VKSLYKIIKDSDDFKERKSCVIPVTEIVPNSAIAVSDDSGENEDNIIEKAEKEALQIIEAAKFQAKEEARNVLEDLKKKTYQEAYENGFDEGRKEGYETGHSEGIKECESLREQAKSVLKNAHEQAVRIIEKNEGEIIELSVYIAEQILRTAISRDDAPLIKIAQDAFREFKDKKHVIISVHPKRKPFFETNIETLKRVCPYTSVTLLEDEKVPEDGCILESDSQVVDTRIDSQLEKIKEILLEMRHE